ncbi:IS30 family transposase, partial [Escherichia coli]
GHWEGDLVSGTKNSHIATLVDRKSRYTIILRLRGKDSVSVNQALTDKFLSLPSELRKSLTWDRGMELARHLEFTVSTGVKVYFCDPQSPWQRGTNENTNGLIRQYFPKKTCLAQYTQHELDLVAAQLKTAQWPPQVLSAHPALFLQVIIQRQCQKRSLPEDAAKHALRSARA